MVVGLEVATVRHLMEHIFLAICSFRSLRRPKHTFGLLPVGIVHVLHLHGFHAFVSVEIDSQKMWDKTENSLLWITLKVGLVLQKE